MFLPQRKVMNKQCLILPKIYHNLPQLEESQQHSLEQEFTVD